MKRLLIILFAILLILVGCSDSVNNENPASNEINVANETGNDNMPASGEVDEEITASDANEEVIEDNHDKEADENKETGAQVADIDETAETAKNEPVSQEPTQAPAEEPAQEDKNEIPKENALKIQGLVEKELILTLDELKAMTDIIFEGDFYSLNNFGTTGYTRFKGVKLWDLLEVKALINAEASKISIIAQDGYIMEFTKEQVKMEYMDETNPDNKYPMIIAWEENGQEYTTDEGNPYKLVVGQKEPGDVNKPQWVSNIDIILVE